MKLKKENRIDILNRHAVNAKDRDIQIWERNALSIDIYSTEVFIQKLKYIHNNPLQEKWKLVSLPEDYKYSSARFYECNVDDSGMLTHLSSDY